MPQAIEFWPLKLLSEVLRVHRDSISQSESCLGSVSVHSLTLPHTFLHSWEYEMWLLGFLLVRTLAAFLPLAPGLPFGPQPCNLFTFGSQASFWPATLQPLCLWLPGFLLARNLATSLPLAPKLPFGPQPCNLFAFGSQASFWPATLQPLYLWLPGFLLACNLATSLPSAPGLPLGPQPCNPFALVTSPKLGLRQLVI
jgi:hypothetical protein